MSLPSVSLGADKTARYHAASFGHAGLILSVHANSDVIGHRRYSALSKYRFLSTQTRHVLHVVHEGARFLHLQWGGASECDAAGSEAGRRDSVTVETKATDSCYCLRLLSFNSLRRLRLLLIR